MFSPDPWRCTGNNRSVAAACAKSLPFDEQGAGHEAYPEYYITPAQLQRAEQMNQADAEAFGYAFDVEGPFGLIYY